MARRSTNGYKRMVAALANHRGNFFSFANQLNKEGVPYLSYSKLTCVQSCQYRYFLEYVRRLKPRHVPDYLTMGTTFHAAAKKMYKAVGQNKKFEMESLESLLVRFGDYRKNHLRNAFQVLRDNVPAGAEVVAVEEPFVLDMGEGLPPCLGIIDLVLKDNDTYFLCDHKTGKNIYPPDRLQMVIYHQHVMRRYQPVRCRAYYDQYRWVNNLARIRKPAFQRSPVRITPASWNVALNEIKKTYRTIQKIEHEQDAPATGTCFFCLFEDQCRKANMDATPWCHELGVRPS
jgi:predicted RecB family nuclease